jgi:hypothetical protein
MLLAAHVAIITAAVAAIAASAIMRGSPELRLVPG